MYRTDPLPPRLAAKFGHLKFTIRQSAREYSAECPVCGDSGHTGRDYPDRFRMFDDDKPLGWCRRCNYLEFADGAATNRLTEEELHAMREERGRLAAIEAERMAAKIARLEEQAYWRGWHDAMGEQARQIWRDAGIPDTLINYWELGYRPNYDGHGWTSPALTIPYFAPGREVTTIQYRLLSPPNPNDKYRFESGLKSSLWLADPDEKPSGAVLLVEGMKKGGVAFYQLVERGKQNLNVVAVPSKSPNSDMLQIIADCEPVYIALDPDAYTATNGKRPAVNRLAKELDARAKIVKLPVKPDDFFTIYGGTPADFLPFLDQAVTA